MASGSPAVDELRAFLRALGLVEHRSGEVYLYEFAGPATAHLFIVSPLKGTGRSLLNLFSTHPPIEERIARLRAMKRGVRVV